MIGKMLENVKTEHPLIHCITNYVTANDCANALLAIGASPIMADETDDILDITPMCRALCINLGTLKKDKIPSMLNSGKIANSLSIPVLLDPVGAGASAFRTQTAEFLIKNIKFSVIRANASEINALCYGLKNYGGVDADGSGNVHLAKAFSKMTGATVIISGETDFISNNIDTYAIYNGSEMMRYVTGSGCILSAITGAFLGANPDNITEACIAAVCAMGVCGERAHSRLAETGGSGAYRNYIIDELFNLSSTILKESARYEKL